MMKSIKIKIELSGEGGRTRERLLPHQKKGIKYATTNNKSGPEATHWKVLLMLDILTQSMDENYFNSVWRVFKQVPQL